MTHDNSQTVIGKSVTIKGEISGSEPLIIEGTVEGRVQIETSVMIRDSGLVKADLDAANLNIAGGVVGNIAVKEKVEIVNGGYVVGDIRAPRVVINDGWQDWKIDQSFTFRITFKSDWGIQPTNPGVGKVSGKAKGI